MRQVGLQRQDALVFTADELAYQTRRVAVAFVRGTHASTVTRVSARPPPGEDHAGDATNAAGEESTEQGLA